MSCCRAHCVAGARCSAIPQRPGPPIRAFADRALGRGHACPDSGSNARSRSGSGRSASGLDRAGSVPTADDAGGEVIGDAAPRQGGREAPRGRRVPAGRRRHRSRLRRRCDRQHRVPLSSTGKNPVYVWKLDFSGFYATKTLVPKPSYTSTSCGDHADASPRLLDDHLRLGLRPVVHARQRAAVLRPRQQTAAFRPIGRSRSAS